jgi:hypothetical protein
MKKILLGAPLLLLTFSASAVPFLGTYDVAVNSDDPGLRVLAQPSSGILSFDLNVGDYTPWTFLFSISTDEETVNDDDRVPVAASIDFEFFLPTAFSGFANGDTEGISLYWGAVQAGVLSWDNGGHSSLLFGDGGILDVYLEDAVFGAGLFGLTDSVAAVNGKFRYTQGAGQPARVPEPAVLTLLGGGLLLIALLRRRRASSSRRSQPTKDGLESPRKPS